MIYVVYGIRKSDDTNFTELLKAFVSQEQAENYCKELINKDGNPFKSVSWQSTRLFDLDLENTEIE